MGNEEGGMTEIIERIMNAYHYALERKPFVDAVYLPSATWIPFVELRRDYITALESWDCDGLEALLSNMFQNSGTLYLMKYGRPSSEDFSEWEARLRRSITKDLRAWSFVVEDKRLDGLAMPDIGNPWGCKLCGDVLVTPASIPGNYYAQRIKHLLKLCNGNKVGEIGSGIGFVPYYLSKMVDGLKYVNFDLPEVLVVCQYFLMSAFPDKKFMLGGEYFEDWDFALLPCFDIKEWTLPVDVFVNIHSLSEMRLEGIEEYVKHIARLSKRYFYQENSAVDFELPNGMPEIGVPRFPGLSENFTMLYNYPAIWREPVYMEYLHEVNRGKETT